MYELCMTFVFDIEYRLWTLRLRLQKKQKWPKDVYPMSKYSLVCLLHIMQYKTFLTAAVIFATNGQNGQGFSYWL